MPKSIYKKSVQDAHGKKKKKKGVKRDLRTRAEKPQRITGRKI